MLGRLPRQRAVSLPSQRVRNAVRGLQRRWRSGDFLDLLHSAAFPQRRSARFLRRAAFQPFEHLVLCRGDAGVGPCGTCQHGLMWALIR
jgi:hypothetical protein